MTAEKVVNLANGEFPSQIYTRERFASDSSELSENSERRREIKRKSLYKKRSDMRPEQLERARERDRLSQQRRRAKEKWIHIQRGEIPPRKPSTRKPRSEMTTAELEVLREKERVAQQNRRARARLKQTNDHSSHTDLLKRFCMFQSTIGEDGLDDDFEYQQGYSDTQGDACSVKDTPSASMSPKSKYTDEEIDQEKLDYMRVLDLQVATPGEGDYSSDFDSSMQNTSYENSSAFMKTLGLLQTDVSDIARNNLQPYDGHAMFDMNGVSGFLRETSRMEQSHSYSEETATYGKGTTRELQGKSFDRSKLSEDQLEQLRKREREYQRARRARMKEYEMDRSGKTVLDVDAHPRRKLSLHESNNLSQANRFRRSHSYSSKEQLSNGVLDEAPNDSYSPRSLYRAVSRRNTRNVDRSMLSKEELEKLRRAEREYQRHRREKIRASKVSEMGHFVTEARSDTSDSGNQGDDPSSLLQSRSVSDASNDSQFSPAQTDQREAQHRQRSVWPEVDCLMNTDQNGLHKKPRKKISLEDICLSLKSFGNNSNNPCGSSSGMVPPETCDNAVNDLKTEEKVRQIYSEERNAARYDRMHVGPREAAETGMMSSTMSSAMESSLKEKSIGEEWKSWRAGLTSEQLERRRRSNREAQRRRRARMKGTSNQPRRRNKPVVLSHKFMDFRSDDCREDSKAFETQPSPRVDGDDVAAMLHSLSGEFNGSTSRVGSQRLTSGCRIKVTPQRNDLPSLLRYGGDGSQRGEMDGGRHEETLNAGGYYGPLMHTAGEIEGTWRKTLENNNEVHGNDQAMRLQEDTEETLDAPFAVGQLGMCASSKRKQQKPMRISSMIDAMSGGVHSHPQ